MRSIHRFFLCLMAALVLASSWVGSPRAVAAISATATPTPAAGQPITARLDPSISADAFAPDQPLVLHFSRPVDPASAKMGVLTDPYLTGDAAWSDGSQTLTFTPQGGFQPGMTYQVYLDPALTGADGARFDPLPQWTLRTLSAPRLTRISPPGGLIETYNPTVQLNFDHDMDPESVAPGLTINPPVAFDLKWTTARMLEITLREPLALGGHYQFSLSGSATDTQGVALGEDVRWDYYIDDFRALIPSVTSTVINISFNYPIDTANSGLPFEIEPALPGKWAWVSDHSARFTAETYLAVKQYAVRFSAPLKSTAGFDYAALPPLTVVPPAAVSGYGPGNDAIEKIQKQPVIWINFIRPVDQKAVEAAFSTTPKIKGDFRWAGNRFSFFTAEALPNKTSMTVTLNTSAVDRAGQPLLSEPFTWTFTPDQSNDYYSDFYSQVSFGQTGANAQVLSADGRRAIQFLNNNKDRKPAIFTLYQIEPGDFAALYRGHFTSINYYEKKPLVDTSGLKKLHTWPVANTSDIQETLLPAQTTTGTYLLTIGLEGEKPGGQLFVVVTHNRLMLKRSGERIWVWATDFKGSPINDLHVRLYTDKGSILREGQTGADGIFSTTLPKDDQPMLVTAMSQDGDLTVSGVSSEWQSSWISGYYWWDWGDSYNSLRPAHYYKGYLYTERPIYRPGQTLFYKAVVRGDDDIHYTLPDAGTLLPVRLLDARGNEVQRQDVPLSAFGTLNGSFTLGDGAMLGDYTLESSIAGETFTRTFAVQDYRKPDYQVEAKLAANAYVVDDQIKVEVDTRYFFGQPVANARVSAKLYQLQKKGYDHWWEEVRFKTTALLPGDYNWSKGISTLSTKTTDVNGHAVWTFAASTDLSDSYYACRSSWRSPLKECYMGIEISAEDGSGQVVSASKAFRVYNSAVDYQMDTGDWMKRTGSAFDVTVSTVDLQGQPAAGKKVQVQVLGYTGGWDKRTVSTQTGVTGADGKLVVPLKIESEGYYEIVLTDLQYRDTDNHQVSDWVYVSSGTRSWSKAAYGDFTIKAERSQYQPYEKAKLIITSSFDGPALLTFERGQVIHSRAVMLTAPLTEVEVEIIPEDAPNIFVVVNAWQGDYQTLAQALAERKANETYYYGMQSLSDANLLRAELELQVDAGLNRLNVTIEPDQAIYQPRQAANLTVRVTNAQNQPVQAELSLALVDEAIFSLSNDRSGLIFDAFYGPRAHNVITYNSLAPYRFLYNEGGRGGGGSPSPDQPFNPRSDFPDTAIWLPEVRTDANGVATVAVTLPDNLTSWRVIVKAVTASTQVGEAITNILTQKDLQVRPMLPRELVSGDAVTLSAMLHNDSIQTRDVQVTLTSAGSADDATGLTIDGDASQSIRVPAGTVKPVTWKVSAAESSAGNLSVTIRASAQDGAEDAITLPLTVRQRAIPTVMSAVGDFSGDYTGVVALPPRLLPGSTAELKLSRSISGSVLDGLEYLTGYPYGCVEQTMSRALPNAVVGRALSKLGLAEPGLTNELPEQISQGLQRLYGYQHDDGGWGWWFDDETDIYQSAWVVFGLSVTQEAGYPVDAQVIERGATYLQEQLDKGAISDLRTRAYVLYSLARAGFGDRAAEGKQAGDGEQVSSTVREQTLALVKDVYALDPFSQAGLALTLHALGEDEQARAVLDLLDARVQVDDERAFWVADSTDGHYHQKTMASNIRTTALGLSAYLQIAPDHQRIPQLVRYLMRQRQTEGWGSTNETAYTVLALTDYLLQVQQNEGDISYQVLLNDKELLSGTFTPGAPAISLALPLDQMQTGPNLVKINATGGARLYYNLTSRLIQDLPSVDPSGTVRVSRAYLDPKTNQPITQAQVGQLVRVQLKIQPNDDPLNYVLVEDHLPGGLEAINEQLNTSSHDDSNIVYDENTGAWVARDNYRWKTFGYNNKEIRGGRVSFFITTLPGKTVRIITYLARATHAGSFSALPTEFSAMYDAGVWGRGGSTMMVVEK